MNPDQPIVFEDGAGARLDPLERLVTADQDIPLGIERDDLRRLERSQSPQSLCLIDDGVQSRVDRQIGVCPGTTTLPSTAPALDDRHAGGRGHWPRRWPGPPASPRAEAPAAERTRRTGCRRRTAGPERFRCP